MSVLRDWYCATCGTIEEDLTEPIKCADCGAELLPMCNGGTGHRARVQDLPPAHSQYWKGHVQRVGAPAASTGSDDGPAPTTPDGKPLAWTDRHEQRSQERRDRATFEMEQRFGQRPLYFTGSKR